MKMNRVEGSDRGAVRLFTLSTCVWCGKTKALLRDMNVGYDYVDVGLLEGVNREQAMDELKRVNPRCSFPSLLVNDLCIVGYDEEKIRGAFERP